MRKIDTVIIHCADTPPEMDIGAKEIRHWHVDERGWDDIGYHYVIRRNGEIEMGRQESVQGAHCSGHNATSLGICMVGDSAFTGAQFHSLRKLVEELQRRYDLSAVAGHYEYSSKTCPNFDVQEWSKCLA
jgi:N-acetylmuramoyl-L-alanine amidase|tara:strand:+ start:127 stop:516 length:390 start_codon:yes stop_codon:yes gene_type:complete